MTVYSLIIEPLLETLFRAMALGVGGVVFVHFAAMAAACEGRHVPWLDAVLIPCTAASGVGLVYVAAFAPMSDMPAALLMTCLALTCFLLRLWLAGLHVSRFLKDKFSED